MINPPHHRKGGGRKEDLLSFSATGMSVRLVVLTLRLSVRTTGDLETCPVLEISLPRFDKV